MDERSRPSVNKVVDHLFRHESVKMVAVLTKMLGIDHLDVAQDIVQDTLLKAMRIWSLQGLPDNPPAWLYTVARNKAIDFVRAKKTRNKVAIENTPETFDAVTMDIFGEGQIQDSMLRMIFACCHPAIPEESQIALSLKTLCGLSVEEISKAYLTSEDTVAKRIYRAKEKIRQEKISLEVPTDQAFPLRLEVVLRVLYLMFNEGYNSSSPDELIRKDLCAEAMRLTHLLTEHPSTGLPQVNALLALMCFQSSRLLARIDSNGNIITLKHQDRAQWNKALVQKGRDYLDRASDGWAVSVYHLEAAIASLHTSSPSFEQTDWLTVFDLYQILYSINPSPIVALNKAIASSYAVSNESALESLRKIKGLEKNHIYHAALAEVYQALGNLSEAKRHLEQARDLTASKAERQLLMDKIEGCR
jgi:RNA polymerase sigma factor (sigma-70 family)